MHGMDCQMRVCTLVLSPDDTHQIDNVLSFLKEAGVSIDCVDRDNGIIDCTGEACLMIGLEKAHLFEYMRVQFTYYAEFPKGHPLDTNGE